MEKSIADISTKVSGEKSPVTAKYTPVGHVHDKEN